MARTATTSTRDYNKYSLPTRPDARFLLILFARMVGRPLANSTAMISNSNGCCHGQCAYDWHQHIYRWTQREYWIENYTHIQIAERVEFNVLLTRYRKNCAQRIQIDQMCASFYDYYYCFFFSNDFLLTFHFWPLSQSLASEQSGGLRLLTPAQYMCSCHLLHVFMTMNKKGETSSICEANLIHLQVRGVWWCASANSTIARATGRSGKCLDSQNEQTHRHSVSSVRFSQ